MDLPQAGLDIWMSISVESHRCVAKLATDSNRYEAVDYQTLTISTLAIIPLYVVDMMQFGTGGIKVPQHEFLQAHADLLRRGEWIIDGFGSAALAGPSHRHLGTPD